MKPDSESLHTHITDSVIYQKKQQRDKKLKLKIMLSILNSSA